MKDRLVKFLAHLDVGQNKFEEKAGLPRGLINKMKDNLTVKTLLKIEKAHPEFNIDWFLTGKGEMLKATHGQSDLVQIYKDLLKEKEDKIEHLNREIGSLQNELAKLQPGNTQFAPSYQSGDAQKRSVV